MDFLLFRCRDLDKLAADLDGHVDFPSGPGEPGDLLKDISNVPNDTQGLLWQMHLAQVEMSLQVLHVADKVVLDVIWVEHAALVFRSCPKDPPETFPTNALEMLQLGALQVPAPLSVCHRGEKPTGTCCSCCRRTHAKAGERAPLA